MNYANGNNYKGDWVDDERRGNGVFTSSNGNRYEGQFKDNKMHGKGKMNYVNKDSYTGDWVDGLRAGHGVFTWSSGARYEMSCSQTSRDHSFFLGLIYYDAIDTMKE